MKWANNFLPPLIDLITDSGYPSIIGGDTPAVSGSVANLALSQTATVTFDLGPNWRQYLRISTIFDFGAAPTNATLALWMSLDGSTNFSYAPLLSGTAYSQFAATSFSISGRYGTMPPVGILSRYLRAAVTLGSGGNTLGAGAKIALAVHCC